MNNTKEDITMNKISKASTAVRRKREENGENNRDVLNDPNHEWSHLGISKTNKMSSSNLEARSRKCFHSIPSPPSIEGLVAQICASIDPKDHTKISARSGAKKSLSTARFGGSRRHDSPCSNKASVTELCRILDLKDVKIDYSKADFSITTYTFFQRFVCPILTQKNPEAPLGKLMYLVEAKWREFSGQNQQPNESGPNQQSHELALLNLADAKEDQKTKPKSLNAAAQRQAQKTKPVSKIPCSTEKIDAVARGSNQTLSKSQIIRNLLQTASSVPLVPASSVDINAGMLKTEELCLNFGLKDVKIDYTKFDPGTLRNYVSFNKYVRPKLIKNNPQAPVGKVLMLVAAKWREFLNQNPQTVVPKESNTAKNPKYKETYEKKPLPQLLTLMTDSRYRDFSQNNENVEQENESPEIFASETFDYDNSDRHSSPNVTNSKSTIIPVSTELSPLSDTAPTLRNTAVVESSSSEVEMQTADQNLASCGSSSKIKAQTEYQDILSYRSSSQKLIRPILAEKNSQASLGKLATFVDEKRREFIRENPNSGKSADSDKKSAQENVSKPILIRPSKFKSLEVKEEIEDRSMNHINHDTMNTVCSTSSNAPENRFPLLSTVKTESIEEPNRLNDAGINLNENKNTSSGFKNLRPLFVDFGVKREPMEDSNTEERNCFPENTTAERNNERDNLPLKRAGGRPKNTEKQNSKLAKTHGKRSQENAKVKKGVVHWAYSSAHPERDINNTADGKNEDEYDVFGRWVAMKIRNIYSPVLKLQAENEISSVLLQKSAEDAGYPVFVAHGVVDHSTLEENNALPPN